MESDCTFAKYFLAVMGDRITDAIHKYYDNSLDNIGAFNSFTW